MVANWMIFFSRMEIKLCEMAYSNPSLGRISSKSSFTSLFLASTEIFPLDLASSLL